MILGLAILFCFLAVGEGVARLASIPVPGSVLGMILLAAALSLGLVRAEDIQAACDALLENLSLLFVPAGVGLMLYFGLPARSWLAVLAAMVPSTFLVLAAVGLLQARLERAPGKEV
jgi:holin-like protein